MSEATDLPAIELVAQDATRPPFGYAHWADRPITPEVHSNLAWFVSTVSDRVIGFCSCGEWAASASIYTHPVRIVQPLILAAWEEHQAIKAMARDGTRL